MADYTFFIDPTGLPSCIEKLIAACKEALPGETAHAVNVTTNFGQYVLLNKPTAIADLPQYTPFANQLNLLAKRPYLDVSSSSIVLEGTSHFEINYVDEADKGRARIKVAANSWNEPQKFTPLLDALEKQFTFIRQTKTIKRLHSGAEEHLISVSHEAISNFSAHASRLATLTSESFEKLHAAILKKTEELDNLYTKKLTELDERYQGKDKDLAQREDQFKERVKQFDLRENTAVRRGIFEDLKTAINDQRIMEIGTATIKKRRNIHILCSLMLAASVTSFAFYSHTILTEIKLEPRLFIPLGTSAIIFASTAIFYLRWMDAWFRDHARAEFANRKFRADMLRAGWVVEMFFEWTNKKEQPIPPELITSCSRGLFVPDSEGRSSHPFDDLQALAKDFQKIKFGKAGLEFERGSDGKVAKDEKTS